VPHSILLSAQAVPVEKLLVVRTLRAEVASASVR